MQRFSFSIVWLAILALQAFGANAQMPPHSAEEIIQFEPAHTAIDFTLAGKLHTTNGHFALKRGTIRIDPSNGNAAGELVIDAASEDSSEALRDAITKHAVLEVERYPEIIFNPHRIQGVRGSQDDFYGEIVGSMELRGGLHQLTVPVHGHISGDQLTAACEFLIPYADWGLDSPNVLSSSEIIRSMRGLKGGFDVTIFPAFAYLLPALRKIPPNLFWVSNLVDIKIATHGQITWAAEPQPPAITVIVPPIRRVSAHSGL